MAAHSKGGLRRRGGGGKTGDLQCKDWDMKERGGFLERRLRSCVWRARDERIM